MSPSLHLDHTDRPHTSVHDQHSITGRAVAQHGSTMTSRVNGKTRILTPCRSEILENFTTTRSQAVARIADRTASQHLWVTWRHRPVTIWYSICHFLLVVLWNGVSLQPFSRYRTLSILGSRVWSFRVTWRHRSCDHLIAHGPFPIGHPLELSLSLMVSEIFNVECNAIVDVTLIRPLNKGQGHSFWYQSISHIRLPVCSQ